MESRFNLSYFNKEDAKVIMRICLIRIQKKWMKFARIFTKKTCT